MHKRILRHEVTIHALTTKLWRVLTNSAYTEQFLFDGRYFSDWSSGSAVYAREDEGNEKVKKGTVQDVVPGISLKFDLSAPDELLHDPVGILYELVPDQGGIMLILTMEINSVSEHHYKMIEEQSKMMLQKIKWLAEYV